MPKDKNVKFLDLQYEIEPGTIKQDNYNGFLSLEPHLGNFQGLSQLELDDVMENKEESNEKTFTIAYNALKGILERI